MNVELYPHQQQAIRELDNGKILWGGVGTGKSRTAIAYHIVRVCGGTLKVNGHGNLGPMVRPKDLYVITTAKKRDGLDWEKEAAAFAISTDPRASYGEIRLVVDSWQNIGKYSEVSGSSFIFDEQRLVGYGAWSKAFLKIAKNNHWIVLSATPGDTYSDYLSIFIAHGWYKHKTEFERRHVVFDRYAKFPKIDHYLETAHLDNLRRQVLVEMPYLTHTTRHVENVIVQYDKNRYDYLVTKRWHIYENRPIRDIAELFLVMRKLVNSDPSRLGAVLQLWEKHPKLIIFYSFNFELEMLRTLANTCDAFVAEWNGHKHEEIPKTDRWLYLVQYTAGSEGWNCVETDAMVFYSLSYSFKVMEQSKGRIDRLNTPFTDLYYYILRSGASIDHAIVKSLAGKRNFNEREFLFGGGVTNHIVATARPKVDSNELVRS
jgi:hypothetical protein